MKKFLFILLTGCLAIGCGNNDAEKKDTAETKTDSTATAKEEDPDIAKGLTLVANNDCLTCHKINETATGPAYQAVAQRYEATAEVVDSLSQKVITGGAGKWGQIPMSPHPQLSKDDAKAMVKYILSLRK
ncbi:MAG: c-type cytochrome [Williamsia sp.]|nr:c-type cytochrome [Williamsia sp.]